MTLARRALGDTGIEVSVLGLGTVKIGRNQGVKYPTTFSIPNDKDAANLLAVAMELGINLLDTAPAYGSSETRLGQLLGKNRQKWVICTKVGEEFIDGNSFFDFSPGHTRLSIERSLNRLQTDYLDIVLVHSDGNDKAIIDDSGVIETLESLKQEGKIRALGMSTKTLEGGLLAARYCDCVMVTWNAQHQDDIPVVDCCHQHHKGVLIKKLFDSGHATSHDEKDSIKKIMETVMKHPGVSSAVVGTINSSHLKENAILMQEILGRL